MMNGNPKVPRIPAPVSPGGKHLWPELAKPYTAATQWPARHELIDRLMFTQAVEAARWLDGGVLRSIAEPTLGRSLRLGFAPFHGGLQFINAIDKHAFVECARALTA